MDGTLDVWDYFYKQNEPALSLQVDGDGLARVKMQEAGRWVAAGSVDGSVYMLELCDGLSQMQQNEKQGVSHMLDRESKYGTSRDLLRFVQRWADASRS